MHGNGALRWGLNAIIQSFGDSGPSIFPPRANRPRGLPVSTLHFESGDEGSKPREALVHAPLPMIGVTSRCRVLSAAVCTRLRVTPPVCHTEQLNEN